MNEIKDSIGKDSPEVVFNLLHLFNAKHFFLKRYVPKSQRFHDEFFGYELSGITNLDHFITIARSIPHIETALVGISSSIVTKTTIHHVPMMDFSNSIVKEYGTEKVKEVMAALGQRLGFILDSGRSFHYYGLLPLSHKEWVTMMFNAPNFQEIGPNYPRHQLNEGACNLRITTSLHKPYMPKVIDILNI